VGKFKMTAIYTIMHIEVDPKCKMYDMQYFKSTFSGSGNVTVSSKISLDEWFAR